MNINSIIIVPFTTLNDIDNKIIQPEHINIELFEHQKTMIYKLCEREEEKKIIINNFENKNQTAIIDTDIIILTDKVGGCKTLDIIGVQSIKKYVTEISEIESFEYFLIEKKNN